MSDDTTLSPFRTGLAGRCPNCGEGSLFDGYLKFTHACEGCGMSFEMEDAGDGPAFFVMSIVMIIIVPMSLIFKFATGLPIWLTLVIWIPLMIILALALLRPAKGLMFNLQWKNKAKEIRSEDFKTQ